MAYRITFPFMILSFTLAGPGWASESGCTQVTQPEANAPAEGQTVYVDPKTGELLSAPPQGEQLQAPAGSSQAPQQNEIAQHVQPDGSVVADIGDRFLTELRVEVVDGKMVTCHRSAQPPEQLGADPGSLSEVPPDD